MLWYYAISEMNKVQRVQITTVQSSEPNHNCVIDVSSFSLSSILFRDKNFGFGLQHQQLHQPKRSVSAIGNPCNCHRESFHSGILRNVADGDSSHFTGREEHHYERKNYNLSTFWYTEITSWRILSQTCSKKILSCSGPPSKKADTTN